MVKYWLWIIILFIQWVRIPFLAIFVTITILGFTCTHVFCHNWIEKVWSLKLIDTVSHKQFNLKYSNHVSWQPPQLREKKKWRKREQNKSVNLWNEIFVLFYSRTCQKCFQWRSWQFTGWTFSCWVSLLVFCPDSLFISLESINYMLKCVCYVSFTLNLSFREMFWAGSLYLTVTTSFFGSLIYFIQIFYLWRTEGELEMKRIFLPEVLF